MPPGSDDRRLRPLPRRRPPARGPARFERAAELCKGGGEFVWLGLHEPSSAELERVGEVFGLHELALEDASGSHQRPKIEDYDDSWFIVLRTARYIDETEAVEFGEIHLFIGAGYAIVVRHGEASELKAARRRLEQRPELLAEGPGAVAWAVLDKIVDDYMPVVDGIENDIGEVESDIFEGKGSRPSGSISSNAR